MTMPAYTENGVDHQGFSSRLGQYPNALHAFKEIPYDYVTVFTLEGQPGTRLVDVINISVEGAFVAVAIGYSFLPPRGVVPPPPPPGPAIVRGQGRLATLDARLAAARAAAVPGADPGVVGRVLRELVDPGAPAPGPLVPDAVLRDVIRSVLLRQCGLDFLYSIVDSGSGRELQNQPIHNIAGLGSADGQRPFRPLAKPMLFMPRSTVRIEVIEQSVGDLFAGGLLYFVLHGYKILGYGAPGA